MAKPKTKKKSAPTSKAKPAAAKAKPKAKAAAAKASVKAKAKPAAKKPAPKAQSKTKTKPKAKAAAPKTRAKPKAKSAPTQEQLDTTWPPTDYPLVEGRQQLTAQWAIDLPGEFARRIEEGSLVLWRPGITVWLDAWGNNRGASREDRMNEIAGSISPEATHVMQTSIGSVSRLTYRLRDENPDGPVEALMAFTFSDQGHLQMGIYFDAPEDETVAEQIAAGVQLTTSESFVS